MILLRFMPVDEDQTIMEAMTTNDSIGKTIRQFTASQTSKVDFIYNPTVLQSLLKNNFIYMEMLTDLSSYAKFLNIFLRSENVDISTKNAILHSIIYCFDARSVSKTKEFRDAIEKNTNLIITIIDNLRKARNVDFIVFGLSALRGIAVEKENLQSFLVKEGDIIQLIQRILLMNLRSPHIRAAVFSLITILMKNPQNQEKISQILSNQIIEDVSAAVDSVDPKQSSVLIRMLEICHKLVKQDSFRTVFNEQKLIHRISDMKTYNGFLSEKVKIAIFYLIIKFFDVSSNMANPEDILVEFSVHSFLSLSVQDLENPESKLVPLTLFCLYSLQSNDHGRKQLRGHSKIGEIEAKFEQISEIHSKEDNRKKAARILKNMKKKPGGTVTNQTS